MSPARPSYKNKTAATLLGLLTGWCGAHRIYLRGTRDKWAWLHMAAVFATVLLMGQLGKRVDIFYPLLPVIVSAIGGFIEALVIGLMADDKFDARYNAGSARRNDSHWPLALILVATMMVGATTLIAAISRLFDLLYTGGAYG
ncbi:MAG: NINE protein [Pseudomonadota bacterium]|nr:NINE protein [Pseudomonadota bacterium]